MANLSGFDARAIDPTGFGPIPAGEYRAAITASEVKPTKNGQGRYWELTFQILDGPFRQRKMWVRLNLDNPNPVAVRIALAELSAICRAVNVLTPSDTTELHDRPMIVRVASKPRVDNGGLANEIVSYRSIAPSQPTVALPSAAPTSGTSA